MSIEELQARKAELECARDGLKRRREGAVSDEERRLAVSKESRVIDQIMKVERDLDEERAQARAAASEPKLEPSDTSLAEALEHVGRCIKKTKPLFDQLAERRKFRARLKGDLEKWKNELRAEDGSWPVALDELIGQCGSEEYLLAMLLGKTGGRPKTLDDKLGQYAMIHAVLEREDNPWPKRLPTVVFSMLGEFSERQIKDAYREMQEDALIRELGPWYLVPVEFEGDDALRYLVYLQDQICSIKEVDFDLENYKAFLIEAEEAKATG